MATYAATNSFLQQYKRVKDLINEIPALKDEAKIERQLNDLRDIYEENPGGIDKRELRRDPYLMDFLSDYLEDIYKELEDDDYGYGYGYNYSYGGQRMTKRRNVINGRRNTKTRKTKHRKTKHRKTKPRKTKPRKTQTRKTQTRKTVSKINRR